MKENRFKTKDLQAAEGFYLAEDVKRSWTEDFVDEDKGEVVPVVRHELVMERGTYLDPDAISKLEFHKQTGDIDEIEVTDIQRTAKPMGPGSFRPWKVTAYAGGKTVVLLLYARSLEGALAIGGEYVSRNYVGSFTFGAVQSFKDSIFIQKDFSDEQREDVFGGEEKKVERAFYQAEVGVLWIWDDFETDRLFIVLAKDVDEVRELVEEWVRDYAARERKRLEEQSSTESDSYKRLGCDFDLSVKSATKIPCTATVPMELSKDYYESLEEEAEEK